VRLRERLYSRMPKEDHNVARLFFLVSGENPTLPYSEVKSILEAEGFQYKLLEGLTQVLRVHADPSCVKHVQSRSAMARVCGIEIFDCKADYERIIACVEGSDVASFIGEGESFAVRIRRVRGSSPEIDTLALERRIGEAILRQAKNANVNLRAPEKTFFGILVNGQFLFGLKMAEIRAGEFVERGTRKRVFFHSATMPAKLARCMVNLAQPKTGDLVLDPFCGTGSFLVEGGLMGCRLVGLDVMRSMVEGSLRNLSLHGLEPVGMAVADASHVPLAKASVDCVATDPPYGTSATTLGLDARDVFEGFFSAIGDFLKKGRRICLAAPKRIHVNEIGERSGFKHLESHFIYIHRSLTREIAVFELS